ncbi:hypothetical protein GCM10009854_06490 [Saccharopolyspora halophila]|uniref:Uncharacterized protein n=1 Tax=Saccharopolyspora halophila TaxID=405551 RepID=A0ABN3FNA0_9PSEU
MSETRPGLVLHLAGVPQPLHIALDAGEAENLTTQLPDLMKMGRTRTLGTADGGHFTVNFTHVATAHIEQTRSDANAYGAPSRATGFRG